MPRSFDLLSVYLRSDSSQRLEKFFLQNVSSSAVAAKVRSPIRRWDWQRIRFRNCGTRSNWVARHRTVYCGQFGLITSCSLVGDKEHGSKTRTGENDFVPDRSFNPKMYATGGPRCPAHIFKEYLARRPPKMSTSDSPFCLAAIVSR